METCRTLSSRYIRFTFSRFSTVQGPPGIGKTTSILCLAHELLGENYKKGVLELNASDERGIDVVRETIKMFAKKKLSLPAGIHKIIILDEADKYAQRLLEYDLCNSDLIG